MPLNEGTIWSESEFKYIDNGATLLNGTCGPNALAMALSWANQTYIATLTAYSGMRQYGLCDPNGASNATGVYDMAVRWSYQSELRAYGEPWSSWYSWVTSRLDGTRAIVINVANGQALVDSISGKGENARNLQYHFITALGYHFGGFDSRTGLNLPTGFWCVDGDNFSTPYSPVTGHLQFYPDAVMSAARPCGAIAITSRHVTAPPPPPVVTAPPPTGLAGFPKGWSDNGTALTAPNGHTITQGFRDYVLGNPAIISQFGMPLDDGYAVMVVGDDPANGPGSQQIFQCGGLYWQQRTNVIDRLWVGALLKEYEGKVATLTQQQSTGGTEHDFVVALVALMKDKGIAA